MRSIPADITLNPIPDDFQPGIADDGRVLKWIGRFGGERYELGLRPERNADALAAARANLRTGIWQLQEFFRLGRLDLMAFASVDRHKGRPPALP